MTYMPVPPARWIEPEPAECEDFTDSTLIALWGDSSGADTAVLTALTGEDPYFSDEPVDALSPVIAAVIRELSVGP